MIQRILPFSLLVFVACLSTGSSKFTRDAGACEPRPELLGEWQSRRSSQLGRATVTIRFDRDCQYSLKISSWLARIREHGEYRVDGDRIVFSRPSAETAWPFQFVDGRLRLTEAPGETHEYRRVSDEVLRTLERGAHACNAEEGSDTH